MPSPDLLVWIDCEMTGLDPDADEIVEIACVVTDAELKIQDPGLQLVIRPSAEARARLDANEFVTQMHTTSGLITELDDGLALADAELRVLEYLQQFIATERSVPLAGNSIGTDRSFIARWMPSVDQFLHYRNIDVSSIKELARRWYPRAYFQSPQKAGGHRALADIIESIDELRYYQAAVFVDPPGRPSDELQAIAKSVRGSDTA